MIYINDVRALLAAVHNHTKYSATIVLCFSWCVVTVDFRSLAAVRWLLVILCMEINKFIIFLISEVIIGLT